MSHTFPFILYWKWIPIDRVTFTKWNDVYRRFTCSMADRLLILYGEMRFFSDYSFQITNFADHSINYKRKLNFLNSCCEVSSESEYLTKMLMNLLHFPYKHASFVSHFQVAPQLIMRLLSEAMTWFITLKEIVN